ncbi:hypothetical protein [Muricoccus radiodurans]|uniref:hypothetical protein n=1 Tax=Muricoccus radiodurans TaxID=2231721 RepID=UPI003CEFEADC
MDEISRFIDILHAIRFVDGYHGRGTVGAAKVDELVADLVAGAKNSGRGAPSFASGIAQRILEAEQNWDQATGKTYCGQMTPPAA